MPKPYKKPDYVNREGGSVGELTPQEAIDDIGGLDPHELPDKGKDHNPGRGIYRKQLAEFATLSDNEKLDALRETWKDVAMGAAVRAKAFVATCAPKDFGGLHKLISAAATGIEQAFPKKQEMSNPQFIINMFGSLGQRAAAIATPPIPTITVEATEVPWPDSPSTSETMSLCPTTPETSPTTTPSAPPLSSSPVTSSSSSGSSSMS